MKYQHFLKCQQVLTCKYIKTSPQVFLTKNVDLLSGANEGYFNTFSETHFKIILDIFLMFCYLIEMYDCTCTDML